jgi:hypothetical protein
MAYHVARRFAPLNAHGTLILKREADWKLASRGAQEAALAPCCGRNPTVGLVDSISKDTCALMLGSKDRYDQVTTAALLTINMHNKNNHAPAQCI